MNDLMTIFFQQPESMFTVDKCSELPLLSPENIAQFNQEILDLVNAGVIHVDIAQHIIDTLQPVIDMCMTAI